MPGHWEGDLLFGGTSSRIATLVERQTRYVMLVKLGGTDTETVVNALIKNARKLPQEPVAPLGSRHGDGGSQALHTGDRHQDAMWDYPSETRLAKTGFP